MKIALMHYSAPPIVGGVESVMAHHARMMSVDGHDVTVFCGRGEIFSDAIKLETIPELDSRHNEVLLVKSELDQGVCSQAFAGLKKRIEKLLLEKLASFDVLIAHNVASLNKNLALTAALHSLHQSPGFPRLILWHHDLAGSTDRYLAELHAGYPWDLLRQAWPGVTQVTISQTRRQEFAKLTGLDKREILVVPNGVDLFSFYKFETTTIELVEKAKLLAADPLFLLPARLTKRKNIELALYILKELQHVFPGARLLITGPEGPHNPANRAYKQKLLDLRDNLGLDQAVIFLAELYQGFVPDEVIADFYRLADALLFTSKEEGFGIPLLEAGFSRQPAFCADIPVLRELGGEKMHFFDLAARPETIAAKIGEALESDKTWQWSRYVKHHYTWQAIYQEEILPLLNKELVA